MIFLKNYFLNTTAVVDILPIISEVRYAIRDSDAKSGVVNIIIPGSGAGLCILEPVPEVMDGLKNALELFAGEGAEAIDKKKEKVLIAPRVRSAMLGRTLSIPLNDGRLLIDPYEEIFLFDLDKKSKRREFYVQVISEAAAEEEGQPGQQRGRAPQKRR